MAVLLTGGRGKTSLGIARLLQDAHIPFLLASRGGKAAVPPEMPATKFDWLDPSSFGNPFESDATGGEKISAIYLIAPKVADPVPSMNAFIDYAVSQHSVSRFVLVGGTTAERGGHHVGQVWQHLEDIDVSYCVLRPTWFMGTSPRQGLEDCPRLMTRIENFVEGHLMTINGEGKIYTACEDAKIPFIAASDIAAVAFHALTDEKPHDKEYLVLGPEPLTFDQVFCLPGHGLPCGQIR